MRAFVEIRENPVYRRDAFVTGLRRVGHEVRIGMPSSPAADTLFVVWNRYGHWHNECERVEAAGGTVAVVENGYVGVGGRLPHSMEVRDPYAIALGYHNDRDVIRGDGSERWNALGVELAPWRATGNHILIMPNRPFGTPGRIMPADWAMRTAEAVRKLTDRDIRIRAHPGNSAPSKPLAEDLENCHAAIVWNSSAGVHALIRGIPVYSMAPNWICKGASSGDLLSIENPLLPDRLPAMHRLAHAQSFLSEIESGEAFKRLLH